MGTKPGHIRLYSQVTTQLSDRVKAQAKIMGVHQSELLVLLIEQGIEQLEVQHEVMSATPDPAQPGVGGHDNTQDELPDDVNEAPNTGQPVGASLGSVTTGLGW